MRHAGADVPVYSLSAMIGIPEDRHATDRHVLVARGAGRHIGLLVDRVVRMPVDEGAHVLPLPRIVGDGALRKFDGLLRHQELAYLVLSPVSIDPRARVAFTPRVRRSRAGLRTQGAADMIAIFNSPALPAGPADRYAVEARGVEALAQSLPSVPIPGAAAHVAALAWWRDEVAPLLSFEAQRDTNGSRERVIVVRCHAAGQDTCVAFAVSGDVTLHRATRADLTVRFDGRRYPFVRGVFEVGGERVALLDLPSLLVPRTEDRQPAVREEVPALI
jgi:chemotaxis signal transduction protein